MPFLTVKEAAALVRKHPSSVRRAIYPIIDDDQHPDRDEIQPNVADAISYRNQGVSFAWKLSEKLLRKLIPVENVAEPTSHTHTSKIGGTEGELIAILRLELSIKNQQIAVQSELISKQMGLYGDLADRLREGNLIIGALHQRLALSDGRSEKLEVVDAQTSPPSKPAKPEKGSASPSKNTKTKKGFFSSWPFA